MFPREVAGEGRGGQWSIIGSLGRVNTNTMELDFFKTYVGPTNQHIWTAHRQRFHPWFKASGQERHPVRRNEKSKDYCKDNNVAWECRRISCRHFSSPEKLLFGSEKRISEIRLHLQANNNLYREEKSLRHVAMVAKFLDDNKPKT